MIEEVLNALGHGLALFDKGGRLVSRNEALASTLGVASDRLSVGASFDTFAALLQEAIIDGDLPAFRDWPKQGSEIFLGQSVSGNLIELWRTRTLDGGLLLTLTDKIDLAAARNFVNGPDMLEQWVRERTARISSVNSELLSEIDARRAAEAALIEAKQEAEQANLTKTRFLAAASHDLIQPLSAARLFIAAAVHHIRDDAAITLVQQASGALDSVEVLLEALLEISRFDAGAIVPDVTAFDLGVLLQSMKTEFAPLARKKGLSLDMDDSPRWLLSDPRLLRRILQNLISNALRYTQAGGVSVSVVPGRASVDIAVRDTGVGIDPAFHQEIFDEFRRLDQGSQDGQGIGLGLAIVKRAAAILEHPLVLRSAPGRGATFTLTVPRTAPAAAAAIRMPAAQIDDGLASRQILIVDNDRTILAGMSALLTGWRCDPMPAAGLEEAIALVRGGAPPPAAIVADYHLDAGERGDVVVQALRKRIGSQVPAIIMSADRSAELTDHLRQIGLQYLEKPVQPARLRAALSQAIR